MTKVCNVVNEKQMGVIKGIKYYPNLTYELTARVFNWDKKGSMRVSVRFVRDICKRPEYAHIKACTPEYAFEQVRRYYKYMEGISKS